MNERPTARGAAPDVEGEFITAPVPATGRRPASRSRLVAIVTGVALLAFLAVTLAGWAMRRADDRPSGTVIPFADRSPAASAPAPRRAAPVSGWHGMLTVPGRSAQTAVLLLRQPAGEAPGPLEFSLYATTWLARGRAVFDPASATLRLDGHIRFVREQTPSGLASWRAVAPWQGVLEEIPR